MRKHVQLLLALSLVPVNILNAQLPKSGRLFEQNCVMCHGNGPGGQGPEAGTLRRLSPEAIVQKLAEALFRGVSKYSQSLSHFQVARNDE